MKKKNIGYSLKNIPIPPRRTYKPMSIEKIESFLKRMQWKAHLVRIHKCDETPTTQTTKTTQLWTITVSRHKNAPNYIRNWKLLKKT